MKKYLIGITSLALAVAFTAFKEYNIRTSSIKFFKLISPADETDPWAKVDPSSWQYAGINGIGIICDMQPDHLCQIQAEEDGYSGKPIIPFPSALFDALCTSFVPAASVTDPRIDTKGD